MASNAAKQPWLSGLVFDPASQKINECLAAKTRFLRVRKAPVPNFVPSYIGGDESLPRYESASWGLHQSLKKLGIFLAVYLGVGTLCFCFVLDDLKGKKTNPILDSVYFVVTTMTTVGYGDLVPDSAAAKLLACIFVFLGMALVGLILGKAGDYLVTKQEVLLVKALHMREKLGPAATLKDIESNKVKYKCYFAVAIILILMLVGSIFLYVDEDFDPVDAFYCVCSTITTLGYGDKAFSSGGGRMFAVCWILTSTVGLGQLFLFVTEVLTESRQMALANWVLTRTTTNLDLEAAHIDDDRIVWPAEFILYKLKEMGKISEEDIEPVMKEFEELDAPDTKLDASDTKLAQTTPVKK